MVGDAGMVVPPRNAEALADAMAALLEKDIEERRVLGVRARARIQENFALADVSRRYYQIYRELAPRPQKLRAV